MFYLKKETMNLMTNLFHVQLHCVLRYIDVFITIISLIFQFVHLYRLHCFAYNTAWPINKPFKPSFRPFNGLSV